MEFEFTLMGCSNEGRGANYQSKQKRLGRKAEYHDEEIIDLVFQCWLGRENMCAKRLVIQLESWLAEHEQKAGPVNEALRQKFLSISAATIDRVLKPRRDEWYRTQSAKAA